VQREQQGVGEDEGEQVAAVVGAVLVEAGGARGGEEGEEVGGGGGGVEEEGEEQAREQQVLGPGPQQLAEVPVLDGVWCVLRVVLTVSDVHEIVLEVALLRVLEAHGHRVVVRLQQEEGRGEC